MEPFRCVSCGTGKVRPHARAGRMQAHRGTTVEVPADLEISTCDTCDVEWFDSEDASRIDAALDAVLAQRPALLSVGTPNAQQVAMSHITDQITKLHTLVDELHVQLHLALLDTRDDWTALRADVDHVFREAHALGPAALSDMIERVSAYAKTVSPLLRPKA